MQLKKLIESLQPYTPYTGEDVEIKSIENDNRKVSDGSLFICIKGYTVDGHDFAQKAYESGAVAVIAERSLSLPIPVIVVKDTKRASSVLADVFYQKPTQKLQLIGITGTNGKTTTSHLIDAILKEANKKTGIIGTMYTKIGEEIQETKNTTPEAVTLQKVFHQMVEQKVDTAVMEVSSHALVEGRVFGCDYDIAVFTNLSQDHLDYHGTMEEYKKAKGLLFTRLGNAFSSEKPKFAILNKDDAAANEYETITAAHILTYGIDKEADIMAKNIKITAAGTSFDLHTPLGIHSVQLKMVGKFNVYNTLASIGAAIASNIPMEVTINALEKVAGVAGRFETVNAGQDFSVIVDYSHTPDSLQNALQTVKEFAKNKIYVIVGCGGDRDKTKRPLMAKIACEEASYAILTSDNPRSEDPLAILKDMEEGVRAEQNYTIISDRKEAIAFAVDQAQPDDVILIAGKGHETYQIIGSKVLDFDDRLVAKEAIEERKNDTVL
ncbi:UDP-N-acetylmuramoyl-L-alanyl-D-glutamate--2,6-diaminopimelate ligase [Niallia circulans]|uniref:UDP-N-acetylmuramoyl-L-alanyl-D-glutamate--2, 6-diaminopimelate ligase n=1 Tax=Niallia circulans TaxID=1397 RepID=UPI000F44B616|nr:UDP-N-acetylmuramoyl-L-alanyl-D-glutamate--2,6-diaminopimelate ligase [Niallia circulans]AYV65915.1 UDP-N-acetylmuramoyl-L-alanyl-D-glutamate--2,6-diaminopimelate ligase [Niallia circulans]